MRAAKLIATFLVFAVLGGLAGVLALVTVPRVVGMTPFTVLSGSMKPGYQVGDVHVDKRVKPLDVRSGDVVTFPDPSRGGALVTHRVERMSIMGDKVAFVTRGDANNVSEKWAVPVNGDIGRVVYRVPKVGWVLQAAGSKEGKLGLIAIPALLLVFIEFGGLLGLKRRPQEAGA